ncbi:MAG TPA: DUF6249 domain-containing protein [Caulobacteraceae bacterium]
MEDILGPLIFFSFLGAVIIVPMVLRYRERGRLHETLRAALDKGQPMSPELLEMLQKDIKPRGGKFADLRRAIVFLGIGLGLVAMGASIGQFAGEEALYGTAAAGMIPLFIGAGFLVLWFFTRGQKDEA